MVCVADQELASGAASAAVLCQKKNDEKNRKLKKKLKIKKNDRKPRQKRYRSYLIPRGNSNIMIL